MGQSGCFKMGLGSLRRPFHLLSELLVSEVVSGEEEVRDHEELANPSIQ